MPQDDPTIPFYTVVSGRSLSKPGYVALPLCRRRGCTERRPLLHEPPSLLKQVAATICGLNLVGDSVGQCHFHDMIGIVRSLRSPIAECGAEAVHRKLIEFHATQQHQKCHV